MATDWITISKRDVLNYLAANQVTTLDTGRLADGQDDRLSGLISDVSDMVRGKIKSHRGNSVSATPGAVPPEAKRATCMLVLESLVAVVPTMALSDAQKELIRRAYEYLDRLAEGKDLVSLASDAVASDAQAPVAKLLSADSRDFLRKTMMGL